jgi:PST family polysaccharide transporter
MVDLSIEAPRRVLAAWFPYLAPVFRHAGWFIIFLMLAPVIGPRGYGLFMVAFGGIAIAEAVLAETAAQALVNFSAPEERHWSTALVTMIVVGGALWLVLYVAATAISVADGGSVLHDIFRSLAMLPLLGGLAVVPRAALRREERQGLLAAASVAGFAAGGGIAVALAWAGTGPWSLVAQIVIQRLVECIVLWSIPGERVGLAWTSRHFAELVGALDRRALAGIWPAVTRYAPCLVVGLSLGPTATGLYMLATRLAEALGDIFLAGEPGRRPSDIVHHACRILLPAVIASALLASALTPLVDLRWWGAVPPAQILLLGAIPAAIGIASAARADELCWQTAQSLGGVVVVTLAVRYGLVAVAAASVGWLTTVALASLWSLSWVIGTSWQAILSIAARPGIAATVAGLLLFEFAEPIGLTLAPLPALCLLTAAGWVVYLVIRGEHSEEFRVGLATLPATNFKTAEAIVGLHGPKPEHSH